MDEAFTIPDQTSATTDKAFVNNSFFTLDVLFKYTQIEDLLYFKINVNSFK